ncbi:MAG TPA: hypothetical protein VFX70_06825 [Mycobacteriales bacterium]|nr:hypothetical protein [Mycobacteriales bacterium]
MSTPAEPVAPVPLYLVAGAPGAGRTELLAHLVRRATSLVATEMDELRENGGLLGAPIAEPAAAVLAWARGG